MGTATDVSVNVPTLIADLTLSIPTLQIAHIRTIESSQIRSSKNTDRLLLLAAAQDVVAALEAPEDSVVKIAKGPAGHAALRTAFMMNIFEAFDEATAKYSAEELAVRTGVERLLMGMASIRSILCTCYGLWALEHAYGHPDLIYSLTSYKARIMRALVGIGIFTEFGEETYSHNNLSRTLLNLTFRTLVIGMSETTTVMSKLPEYIEHIGRRNPQDTENALFQYAHQTKLTMFEYLKTQPKQLSVFSKYMAASAQIQESGLHAILSSLFASSQYLHRESVLLVDVGGGRGQVLRELRKQRPDLQGRMIVQDLPQEVQDVQYTDGVEAMPFDFFMPQPIKGAHVYFFRHVFHNWPDHACRQILTNTIQALTPNHSRLVIVDQVVPDVGASPFASLIDISMMAIGGMERTQRQWTRLVESVGLRIKSIGGPDPLSLSRDSVIEVVVNG